jgi:hypothetical protein
MMFLAASKVVNRMLQPTDTSHNMLTAQCPTEEKKVEAKIFPQTEGSDKCRQCGEKISSSSRLHPQNMAMA